MKYLKGHSQDLKTISRVAYKDYVACKLADSGSKKLYAPW
jgi:hypothetical protein